MREDNRIGIVFEIPWAKSRIPIGGFTLVIASSDSRLVFISSWIGCNGKWIRTHLSLDDHQYCKVSSRKGEHTFVLW